MKYGLISDIHGNVEALRAVLSDIKRHRVDSIHCLGDVVGYGADPTACLKLVLENCDTKLLGNHEYAALGLQSCDNFNDAAKTSTEWTQQTLDDDWIAVMSDFAVDRPMDDMYLVHASPFEPSEWHYILSATDAINAFEHLKQRIGFFGHSHIPTILREKPEGLPSIQTGHDFTADPEGRYLVNVGSVGQPRDNDPRASYVVFDSEELDIEFHRVEYDIEAAQHKMSEANLPSTLISRLSAGI
ncbi:MAG: metallophosphatase family protein [candidate division Zixibacteria bacterium]|nr:metallophosphatase family protein [candidate division Zixibacteria bacterium]MDH3937696.1 metallophosphatase family protein [candidate division Zixibacteria bacterium]